MTGLFLNSLTLGSVVAPLTEAEFLALLRERKLTLLRGTNGDRYKALLNWDALKTMIERGEYPREPDYFHLAKESAKVPPERWQSEGKVQIAKLEEYLADGFSIIITHIEQYVPHLTMLCDDIKSRLHEATYVGVIVTAGKDGAFKVHYDSEDLIILQLEGTKRWQIFGPAVQNPVRGMPKQSPPGNAPIFDDVLHAGDLLFLPAGNWHHCEAGPGKSLHLGIFIIPPTGSHAVRALASQLPYEEMFRTPLTRLEGPMELAALEAEFKRRLVEKIGQLNLSEFLAEWNKKALKLN